MNDWRRHSVKSWEVQLQSGFDNGCSAAVMRCSAVDDERTAKEQLLSTLLGTGRKYLRLADADHVTAARTPD